MITAAFIGHFCLCVCEFLIIHVRWVIFTVNSNMIFFHLICLYWILFHCSLSSSQCLAYFIFQQIFLQILSPAPPLPFVTFWKGLYLSRQFHLSFDLVFDVYAFTFGSKPCTEILIQGQSMGAWLWLLGEARDFLEILVNLGDQKYWLPNCEAFKSFAGRILAVSKLSGNLCWELNKGSVGNCQLLLKIQNFWPFSEHWSEEELILLWHRPCGTSSLSALAAAWLICMWEPMALDLFW